MKDEERLHTIHIKIGKRDFVYGLGRKPKNMDELEKFCRYCEKGIHAQIDGASSLNALKMRYSKVAARHTASCSTHFGDSNLRGPESFATEPGPIRRFHSRESVFK